MLGAIVLGAMLSAVEGAAVQGLSFDDAVALALSANPSLAAARLQVPVVRGGIDVARQRANPDLTLEATRETPRQALTLAFPIETAGKRARRIDVATAAAGTGDVEVPRAELALRGDVRRAYYALCAAQRRVTEATGLRGLAERARDAARQRFDAGAAPKLEVLSAELAAAQAANEAFGAEAGVTAARADLNVLLARPAGDATAASGDLGAGTVPDEASSETTALAGNADLAVLDGRIREQRSRVALARAQQSPDVTLQGAVTHDAPGDFDWGWRAAVSLTLPLFHHRRAETRVEELTLTQLSAERVAVASAARGAIFAATAAAASRREQYLRYRDDILPRTTEVESMAEDSYRSGQTSLVAMIQAITAIRDLKAKAIQAGLDYQNALADLERAVGAPLP